MNNSIHPPNNLLLKRLGKFTKFVLLTFKEKFQKETLLSLNLIKNNYTMKEQYEILSYFIRTSNYAKCKLLGISIRQGEIITNQLIRSRKFKAAYGRCPITGRWVIMLEFLNFQL